MTMSMVGCQEQTRLMGRKIQYFQTTVDQGYLNPACEMAAKEGWLYVKSTHHTQNFWDLFPLRRAVLILYLMGKRW